MKVVHDPLARLRALLIATAILSTLGLTAVMSSTNGYLAAALREHDAQLDAISQRAERLQTFSRHIRKASLTDRPELDLPFAGFIGSPGQLAPGATLALTRPHFSGQALEIIATQKVVPALGLISSTGAQIDLLVVTGRIAGATAAPLIRFLVAVTNENSATRDGVRQHSL